MTRKFSFKVKVLDTMLYNEIRLEKKIDIYEREEEETCDSSSESPVCNLL